MQVQKFWKMQDPSPSSNTSGIAYIKENASVFDGYKLAEDSPAINAGKVITDNNGYDLEHDFFGHALTHPEIGAAESDYVTVTATSNVYVANDQISGRQNTQL